MLFDKKIVLFDRKITAGSHCFHAREKKSFMPVKFSFHAHEIA